MDNIRYLREHLIIQNLNVDENTEAISGIKFLTPLSQLRKKKRKEVGLDRLRQF